MNAWKDKTEGDGWTMYLGDCREIMPTLTGIDAVVTDPPYGIGRDGQRISTSKHGGRKAYEFRGWDRQRPDGDCFAKALQHGNLHIFWGGNFFADMLPPTAGWLVWDKDQDICSSDCELAWTSRSGAIRRFRKNRVDLMLDGAVHPTQKPVSLMRWCLEFAGEAGITVLDPFSGSGTTGVACIETGRKFIGIEIDETYYRVACNRLRSATPCLFGKQPSTVD